MCLVAGVSSRRPAVGTGLVPCCVPVRGGSPSSDGRECELTLEVGGIGAFQQPWPALAEGSRGEICMLHQELVFSCLVQFFPLPLPGDLLVLCFWFI